MIKTKRLLIRKFHIGDLPDVYNFLKDPAVMAFSGMAPFTLEQSGDWLLRQLDSYPNVVPLGVYALESRQTKRVVGYCGLEKLPKDIADEIEISVGLASGFWGNGYGLESVTALLEYAVHHCRLERIAAVVHVENRRAKHLLRRCGFQQCRKTEVNGVGPHLLFILELSEREA